MRKLVCNRFFALTPSIFQIFGVENAGIFRAKFADRARSALRIPKNPICKLRTSSSRRALPLKMRKNILKTNSRACGVQFLNFRRRKRAKIWRKFSKMRRVRRCACFLIAFAHCLAVRCVSGCEQTCLQTIFCICTVDFSNFRRRKRGNFSRKLS